jgi:hypothetical protein
MSTIVLVIVLVIVIACVATAFWVTHARRELRASFGPEYDQLVQERGGARAADRELLRRTSEYKKLNLQPIEAQELETYLDTWEHLQGGFIDDPVFALSSAEQLVTRMLDARGYPGDDPQERVALLSVEYGDRVAEYRTAREINQRAQQGKAAQVTESEPATYGADAAGTAAVGSVASTEEIRKALLSYRALFNEVMAASGFADTSRLEAVESPGLREESPVSGSSVAPAEPVETVEPAEQVVEPAEEVEPVEQVEPVEEVGPVAPVAPLEQVDPVDPVQTVDPVEEPESPEAEPVENWSNRSGRRDELADQKVEK